MKRLFTIAVAILFTLSLSAQSTIDKLFNKYQGQKGFTTVTVSGSMFKFLAEWEDEDEDLMKFADKFTSLRILTQDDENVDSEDFYNMVIDEVNSGGYEEMVTVNSDGENMKILVKAEGKVFKEFLLVAGGDDNAIIQIKGNMTYDEVKSMSASVKDGEGISGISGLEIF